MTRVFCNPNLGVTSRCSMKTSFWKFLHNESGNATVEWVILTAGVVVVAGASLSIVAGGLNSKLHVVAAELSGTTAPTLIANLVLADPSNSTISSPTDTGSNPDAGEQVDEADDDDRDKSNCGRGSQKDHEPGPNGRNDDKCVK